MKKKYINYLLFALVLSLCIFYFYGNLDGFQTSPVDFTNFSGTLTGIRVALVDPYIDMDLPEIILKNLLGGNLTDRDVKKMMERPNGDLIIPYFYINPTGDSGSVSYEDDPYNVSVMPEIYTAFLSGANANEVTTKMLLTFNFSRTPKIPPIVLTNQNIKVIFNNIYANLYKNNLKLVSLVLNNTIDYPTVDYSPYNPPIPTLTPKVTVNLETRLSSVTVKMSLSHIIQKFEGALRQLISQSKPAIITLINSDGSRNTLTITLGTSGGTSATNTPSLLINNGSIQATSEMKVYKLDFLDTLSTPSSNDGSFDPYKLFGGGYSFDSQNTTRFMFENSPKIPDSVIQNYISPMILAFRLAVVNMFNLGEGANIPFSPDQLLTVNLTNPSQEIKVDIGTETKSTSPSSILDEVKNLLCI